MKKLLLFALMLSAGMVFAASANLIENPDFTAPDRENGKSHGAWWGDNPIRFKAHFYHKIDKSAGAPKGQAVKLETDGPSVAVNQYLKTLKPNTKYRFSFSIKVQNVKATKKGGGFFTQFYFGRKIAFPRPLLTGTTDWKKYTFEFTTPAKIAANSYLELRSWEAAGTGWFADIELTEVKK